MSKPQIRRPDLDTVFSINEDGSRNMLHPADVKGRWQIRKDLIFTVLIVFYAALPWIRMGGHPAVHIDLPGRAAHLFGTTFTNQDFYLAFFLISGIGFALFVVTSLWGRVWCGFACPQTVFMEGAFRRFERWIEGPRERRIRRNLGPTTVDKAIRKSIKHVVFLALAFVIAHIFLSYFIPVRDLLQVMRTGPSENWANFGWTIFWTAALYFDYAWFREQTCLVICPYGRLQSALIDTDTVIIGYDEKRGEPRTKAAEKGGDCVDCHRCVVVCPTGIDIRNGLQMECIGCANCIDACDEIMDKIGRPHGLVRYDSRRGFEESARWPLLRPRFFAYVALALVGLTVASFSFSGRTDFEVRALRSRGMPYTLEETRIRNVFSVRVQNKTDLRQTYFLEPESIEAPGAPTPEFIISQARVRLAGLADTKVPIFVYVGRDQYKAPFELGIAVTDSISGAREVVKVRFRGP